MKTKFSWNFAIGSFLVSSVMTIPFVTGFAYMNMVRRMGMPATLDTFSGPLLLGFVMALFIALPHTFYFMKMRQLEQVRNRELAETQLEVIMTLTEAAESRCGETGAHIKRVSEYARLLGELAGLDTTTVQTLKYAAPLHDLGKISIRDEILHKPSKLTPEEFEEMKDHAHAGWRILAQSTKPLLKAGAIIAHQHHEKWDGSGYPQKLAGNSIDIMGRIVAIADVFDALISSRPYKPAWPMEKVIQLFREQSGKHFDPHLVELFLSNIGKFEAIHHHYADNEQPD